MGFNCCHQKSNSFISIVCIPSLLAKLLWISSQKLSLFDKIKRMHFDMCSKFVLFFVTNFYALEIFFMRYFYFM